MSLNGVKKVPMERNLSCKSAKENAYIPKSRRDTTNFLLGHRQKPRKRLKAQEDSSAQPAKRWPRDIPTPPPWALAPQSSYQGWALGWGRCCQDSPWAGGRLGRRKSGPHAKPTESWWHEASHPTTWQSRTRWPEGQGRHSSRVLFTCAEWQRVMSFIPHH